jgi:hypothetical protein
MKCKQEDCFKCPYEDCILDEGEKPTKQRDYAEYQREYYKQHMEERKAYQRKYYEARRAEILKKRREARAADVEAARAKDHEYYEKHKLKNREKARKRYRAKKLAEISKGV